MQRCTSWPKLPAHMSTTGTIVAIFGCLILSVQETAAFESDRCMACSAVSIELGSRLTKEKPRNHLDMRHRLDSEGKRYGRMIDYKFSELRTVELLDGICDIISEYELAGVVSDPGSQPTWQWLHPKSKHSSNSTKLDKPQLKQQQRRLQNYCAQLIDKAEEGVSSALQKGLSSADLQSLLCTELSKDCQPPSEQSVQHTEL